MKNTTLKKHMKHINIEEIHKIHTDMLLKVTKYLEENNIKYFLDYGTLIGAIRHNGFIPWDDDIDISMSREEYEKLIDIAKKNNKIDEYLYFTSIELNNSTFPFCKVYNKKYGVEENKIKIKDEYLWIDIFPYDNITADKKEDEKIVDKILIYKRILAMRNLSFKKVFNNSSNVIIGIIKIITKLFVNIFTPKFYAKKMRKIAVSKNKDENCKYVQNIVWISKLYNPINKENLNKFTEVEFENNKYRTIASYDEHLTNIYGDYMELPPIEKRDTHLLKIWENEDEK